MSSIPPGWHHNPTSRRHRAVLIALAALGFAIAAYLSLYQFRLYESVWDPIFGGSHSKDVLDWTYPFPDAMLGVIAYATEVALLIPGRDDRWRTMPGVC